MNHYLKKGLLIRSACYGVPAVVFTILLIPRNLPLWISLLFFFLHLLVRGLVVNYDSYELREKCDRENPGMTPEKRLDLYQVELCSLQMENSYSRRLSKVIIALSLFLFVHMWNSELASVNDLPSIMYCVFMAIIINHNLNLLEDKIMQI